MLTPVVATREKERNSEEEPEIKTAMKSEVAESRVTEQNERRTVFDGEGKHEQNDPEVRPGRLHILQPHGAAH